MKQDTFKKLCKKLYAGDFTFGKFNPELLKVMIHHGDDRKFLQNAFTFKLNDRMNLCFLNFRTEFYDKNIYYFSLIIDDMEVDHYRSKYESDDELFKCLFEKKENQLVEMFEMLKEFLES